MFLCLSHSSSYSSTIFHSFLSASFHPQSGFSYPRLPGCMCPTFFVEITTDLLSFLTSIFTSLLHTSGPLHRAIMQDAATEPASADNDQVQHQPAPAGIHHSNVNDIIEDDGDFDDASLDSDVLQTTLASDHMEDSPSTKSLANRSHTRTASQPILAGAKQFSRPVDDHQHGQTDNSNPMDQFNFAPRNMKIPTTAPQRQTALSVETPKQDGNHAYSHTAPQSFPSIR